MDHYPLNSLGLQIKDHWRKYRPKMYRALEAAGELDKAVYEAQERTGEALAELVQKGMDWNQAWELIREEWAFLPDEEDEEAAKQPPDPAILIEQYEQRWRSAAHAGTEGASKPTEGPASRPASGRPMSGGDGWPAWAKGLATLWVLTVLASAVWFFVIEPLTERGRIRRIAEEVVERAKTQEARRALLERSCTQTPFRPTLDALKGLTPEEADRVTLCYEVRREFCVDAVRSGDGLGFDSMGCERLLLR